jgi:hypothetical protein
MNTQDTGSQDASETGRIVSRRRVLRGAGIGAATIVVAGTGAVSYRAYDNGVFGETDDHAFDAWRSWRDDPGSAGMVAAAVLAASPHNTQPWWFRIGGSRIELFADQSRGLGTPDPDGRELRVGLGCALENQITERIDRDRALERVSEFGSRMANLMADPDRQALATFRIGRPLRTGRLSPRRPAADVIA